MDKFRRLPDGRRDEQVIAALLIIVLLAVLIAAMIFVPQFFMKRAVRKVIAQFRAAGATSPEEAATLAELGLVPPGLLAGIGRVRDYRPHALRLLVRAEIILTTEEGTVYLSEESLAGSPMKDYAMVP